MKFSALMTSAGINIGLTALFLSLYSVLRKQPGFLYVYFGRRIVEEQKKCEDAFTFERLVPSPSWILRAWNATEDEILAIAGLDGIVFLRILVFSIRIFSISAIVCIFGVLPLNYFAQQKHQKHIHAESLDVFTIGNVKEGSRWLWAHCLALHIICFSACILLYYEYKSIARMRLSHIVESPPNLSHFSVLVRAIPRSTEETISNAVQKFFMNYHASSYLAHQTVYRSGRLVKLMNSTKKVFKKYICLKANNSSKRCRSLKYRCGLCGGASDAFHLYCNEYEPDEKKTSINTSDSHTTPKECLAAFVFFKTRYAAVVGARLLQSSNPMLWVTDLAPEPHDVYWSNLCIPYGQLWIRQIVVLLASILFMFLFLIPVTCVQGLTQLDVLQRMFPYMDGVLEKTFMTQLVTGYLPSVILQLFLYAVPPIMMLFSAFEGCISHSGRKKSACCKVLYFTIWNVFFVNVISGSFISQLDFISNPKVIPSLLARAVPRQATFFITYVLTSGWVSLSSEILQLFALTYNAIKTYIFRIKDDPDSVPSFPYHTEVPRLLLFGLLGFSCSIFAPLILPFLLIYFFLGYVVYRNQILNVYRSKYETGGQIWPIVHNATVFSLILTQIIAIGVFGLKKSRMAVFFTILLLICTLLFNEYCRQRFHPIFQNFSAQDLIEMDREDEQFGRLEGIHQKLPTAYWQFPLDEIPEDSCEAEECDSDEAEELDHPQQFKSV